MVKWLPRLLLYYVADLKFKLPSVWLQVEYSFPYTVTKKSESGGGVGRWEDGMWSRALVVESKEHLGINGDPGYKQRLFLGRKSSTMWKYCKVPSNKMTWKNKIKKRKRNGYMHPGNACLVNFLEKSDAS